MSKEANHPVRTSEKTLQIVETLKELNGARIHELANEVEMTKGAIHNHLSTLHQHGYVYKQKKEYHLSLQFLTVGGHVRSQNPLYDHGRSEVVTLANDTGMLTNLLVEENGRGVYLYQARGEYAVSLDTHVGYRIRLHNIGAGKAILAYLPEEYVEEIVEKWGLPKDTENTITSKESLFEELRQIRQQGYAVDQEERTEGLCCIGAPIRPDNEILGSISVSAPTSSLREKEFDEEIVGQVKSSADQIALNIKYS